MTTTGTIRLPPSSGNLRYSAQKHQLVSRPCNCPLCSSRLKKVKCKTSQWGLTRFLRKYLYEKVTKRKDPLSHGNSSMVDPPWTPLKMHGPPHLHPCNLRLKASWHFDGQGVFQPVSPFSPPATADFSRQAFAPLSPLPQGQPLPENLQQGFSKVTCLLLQSETRSHFKVDIGWHFGLISTISAGHFSLIHMSKVFMRLRVRNQVVQMKDCLLMHHLQLHN